MSRAITLRLITVLAASCLGAGCGGGSKQSTPVIVASVPGAPLNLTANVGTTDSSLGWDAPTNNGGVAIQAYDIDATPTIAAANIVVTGTRAVLRNLSVGINYAVRVRARNSVGVGPIATISFTPQAVNTASYQVLSIAADTSPSGVFDPSILRLANGDLWMSYSSVDYHNNSSNQLVQDVGIRLARSADNGATFSYVSVIATPSIATVTDTDPALSACGAAMCTGRWVYETSWLIDDSADPNSARRYKLFAHKYFLSPGRTPSATLYHLGSIVMWTASAPDATWSMETSLLGWNLTPPQLTPLRNVNAINAAELGSCLLVAEGSASVRGATIDFAFACPYVNGAQIPQKIVLLRSLDHANTFQYVATLLTAADAAPIGATHFSAPALLATPGTAPVLLATPVIGGNYAGCIVIPFSDDATGQLFRVGTLPVGILYTPTLNAFGGACTYDRGLGARGILVNSVVPGATIAASQFRIYASRAVLQL
jgi:hypothetical protein